MNLIPVDKANCIQAIRIQNAVFPHENGAVNILASMDRDLFTERTGVVYPDHRIRYWLAEEDHAYVGITGLYSYDSDPETVWLGWFGILPEYRSKGYGRQVLEKTMEKAQAEGFTCMRLYTDYRDNHNAVQLYEQEGFTGEKYTAEELPYDCRIYSKRLDGGEAEPWDNRFLALGYQSELEHMSEDRIREIIKLYE